MVDHWHLAVGSVDSKPFTDLILSDNSDIVPVFLDFCQSFFHHDFNINRAVVESKMNKVIAEDIEPTAFQMTGGGYAAVAYPCTEGCLKESLN